MKLKKIYIFCILTAAAAWMSSCKKESQNIFNMFTDVTVTYHGDHPFSVTEYKAVNDGDSVYIDYTVASAKENMYSIVIEKSTDRLSRTTIKITDDTRRRTYSDVLKLKIQRDGKTSYRIYALDEKGYFIGDGGKTVVIDAAPSYSVMANRRLYAPDTATRVAPAFYSVSKGQTFNYTDGAANSSDIDFGVYRVMKTSSDGTISYDYFLFSLIASPNPLTVYDFSSWTKRTVYFASTATNQGNTFRNTLISSSVIETEAKKKTYTITKSSAKLAAGNLIYFKTPEGKYGGVYINSITEDLEGKPYVDISVKVQN